MLESIFNWLSQFVQSFITILKILFRSYYFPKRHHASSDELFIIANGPSFKNALKQEAEFFKSKTLLCVNNFPNTEYFAKLKPRYFLICSPGYWMENAIDYNVEKRRKIIDALVQKTNWELTCLLPYASRKNSNFIKKIESNQYIKIHYYNTTPLEGLESISISLMQSNLAIPRPHNVLVPSLHFAISNRFNKIYLLGADHSWLGELSVNDKNEVLLNQKHFYDEEQTVARQMHKNHGRGQRKMHEVLEKFYISFKSYHLLNKFAQQKKVEVINLTPNSFIDAFEKKSIDSIK